MALKNLSTRTMVKLGGDLVRKKSPQRVALEAVPQAAVLIPDLERAQAGVIAAQPPSQADIDKLTQALARGDARHDELVRCIDDRLLSELGATKDETVRELIAETRAAVLATGRGIVNRSFLDEAGEGELRAARVTEAHRKVLRKLKTYEGVTYEQLYDELQGLAKEIGTLEKKRSDRNAALEQLTKNRDARNQWIRVVNGIAAMLELAGVDETPILGNLRAEEAKAELRVGPADQRDETDAGTDTTAVDPSATDALDPPPPADDGEPSGPTS